MRYININKRYENINKKYKNISKKYKSIKKNMNIFILLIFFVSVLGGCDSNVKKDNNVSENKRVSTENLYINGEKEEIKVLRNTKKINIEYRDKLYILDEENYERLKDKDNNLFFTYDSKIIDDFNLEDIEAYKKFNDFYAVLLKDGEEIKLFDRPYLSKDKEIKDIEGIDSEKIVGSYKHGDHYHVKLDDGSEYITYDDPISLSKDDLDKSKESKSDKNKDALIPVVKLDYLKDKNIVKIYKHGDHFHVELDNGDKFLTYEDPSKEFSDIEVEEYEGEH